MVVVPAEILGYCMGVRRAVERALAALEAHKGGKVYSLGPLIHNRRALEALSERGLSILEDGCAAKAEPGSCVIVRAHGVPPETVRLLSEKNCAVVDATCPRVVASQKRAAQYAAMGYTVLFAGDKNHGEVAGIAGYAGPEFILVQNREEAAALPALSGRAALMSQTTFSPVEFAAIAEILSKKCRSLEVVNTICPATRERQEALLRLCPRVDGVLVVGGRNSANTRRLLQTAEAHCRSAALIECAAEIPAPFFRLETVGITAGASTPAWIIKEVYDKMSDEI
ncbi:MAG: 4-hydroxy-3-methylbut-2-enyl diphosphate reductase, partial [Treponemataceae bacterium]|nr:4-hydroxy-3-methylbut-2-enyl diphosphate reductase [Treponemataceae bacterium]